MLFNKMADIADMVSNKIADLLSNKMADILSNKMAADMLSHR